MDFSFSHSKEKLAKVSIYLLAFDSFPIFIGGSIYRPIAIFPLLFYFCLLAYENLLTLRIKKVDATMLGWFSYLLGISFIKAMCYGNSNGVKDFFFTGAIGIACFISLYDYFLTLRLKYNEHDLFNYVGHVYIKAMILPCVFGVLEVLRCILHIPIPFFFELVNLVTYRYVTSRVFLVCGEPAWAATYLIIYLYFLIFCDEVKHRKLLLCMALVLTLLTLSMYAYLSIVIAFIFYFIFLVIKNPSILPKFVIVICLGVILLLALDRVMITTQNTNYAILRYLHLRELVLLAFDPVLLYKTIQVLDDSVFIRFVNPLIGIMMAFAHPIFGTGGGYYFIAYPEYITKYFPLAIKFGEVRAGVTGEIDISPRNLFAKFFSEYGLFIGFYILCKCIGLLNRIEKDNTKYLWLLSLIFMAVLNFDSLCYVVFIFLLTFFIILTRKDKKS